MIVVGGAILQSGDEIVRNLTERYVEKAKGNHSAKSE